jgi:hypothetical protein
MMESQGFLPGGSARRPKGRGGPGELIFQKFSVTLGAAQGLGIWNNKILRGAQKDN